MEKSPRDRSNSNSHNLSKLFWVVVAEIVLYIALDVLAQNLPPYYSPISQAESDLAVGPFGYLMAINFLNRGILSLVFVYAFLKTIDIFGVCRPRVRAGTYLVGVWGIGALLLAAFPTDVPPTPVSLHGAIHLFVALIAFICGAFGAFLISLRMGESGGFRKLRRRIAMPISILVLLFWIVEFSLPLVAPHLSSRIGGLTERLFLGSMLLWVAGVSAYLGGFVRRYERGPISNRVDQNGVAL